MYYKYYYLNDNKSHIDFIKKYDTDNLYDYFKKHILLKNILISVTCPLNKTDHTIKLLSKAFNFKKNNDYPLYSHDFACMYMHPNVFWFALFVVVAAYVECTVHFIYGIGRIRYIMIDQCFSIYKYASRQYQRKRIL